MSPTQSFVIQLVEKAAAWPVVVLIIALVVLVARHQIPDLVARIISIGREGVQIVPPSQQINATTSAGEIGAGAVDVNRELSSLTDLDLLDLRANAISADLEARGLHGEEREATLVKLLAGALLREGWERVDKFIYGSKLRLLQRLNENLTGVPEQGVREVYIIRRQVSIRRSLVYIHSKVG